MIKKYVPILLILLLAFFLRTHQLTEIPPGLTHDEANHGRDSINILDGVLLFYFPLNYGSEPLYNYVVAGNMALLGENLFGLRMVNVMSGLLAITALYLWACWALDQRTALIAAALMAVSFWPLAASRQALRAGMLPFLIALAVIFFWQILRWAAAGPSKHRRRPWWAVAGFALCVAATLHTYLAARVLWLIFPAFLVYLAIVHRAVFRKAWRPVLAGLIAAGLLVIPMFAYVRAHPEADTRLEMLDGPLQNLTTGNLAPVLENVSEALLAFFWPGYGDSFLAYNIPGRPLFGIVTAVFFLMGLIISIRRWRQPAYAFLLLWFIVGIMPSLITGPTANTTRNLGAMPATYLLPAVGFVAAGRWLVARWGRPVRLAVTGVLLLWLFLVGTITVRDYFISWAQSPDVRAAYQHTLVQALNYLDERQIQDPIVISTVYPGAAHDSSIARVLLATGDYDLRWADARYALIFPEGDSSHLVLPASTPLNPAFEKLARQLDSVALRDDDLDPSFSLYQLQIDDGEWSGEPVDFGGAVTLLGSRWAAGSVRPGETAELLTFWQVTDPGKVGPLVPPAFETDVVLFAHVLDGAGNIMSQQDVLDAPSWSWQTGDFFVQVHTIPVPEDSPPGSYVVIVGIYDRTSGDRLPVLDAEGDIVDTRAFVVPLTVDGP